MLFNLRNKKALSMILSLSILVAMMFTFSTSSVVNASANDDTNKHQKKVETFVPDNPEQFIKEQGWEKPTPNAKLVSVTRVIEETNYNEENNNIVADPNLVQGYSIRNVKNLGQLCGSTVVARTSGTGNIDGVLSLQQAASVSNSYTVNIPILPNTISAAVGFDVTQTMTRTTSYSVNTKGKNYQIVAYDDYEGKSYDVYDSIWGIDRKVGEGTALKQVGFCYAAYQL
ncbi:hypothetical protein G8C92_12020 [Paenibacillus donghaensis]|uniref:hypothetical protein n=1 Tax=Paenibacillus donghaensis TaxID=414771 RepID=UPI0018847808|nr:hypothetical protein [Paenibacillus donghaensis]MBE9914760.1 hypothetical protein [Paenibacillus donghaensis]